MSATIFISYRREDTGPDAIALRDVLRREFGDDSLFMDTSSLAAGTVWPDELRAALEQAQVVLVLIGPDWLRAGMDEWGRRRIDHEEDWVRQELNGAFDQNKTIVPVLVRDAKLPPPEVLPEPLRPLSSRQWIDIRRDYWDHDVKLLLAQLESKFRSENVRSDLSPYPRNVPEGPDPVAEEKLQRILDGELKHWEKTISPLPEKPSEVRIEIFREFNFKTFRDAVEFMNQVAPGCDIAMHHPRWENIWKTLRVYLTTWDIGHRISDRDVQMARYFDRSYAEFYTEGRARE